MGAMTEARPAEKSRSEGRAKVSRTDAMQLIQQARKRGAKVEARKKGGPATTLEKPGGGVQKKAGCALCAMAGGTPETAPKGYSCPLCKGGGASSGAALEKPRDSVQMKGAGTRDAAEVQAEAMGAQIGAALGGHSVTAGPLSAGVRQVAEGYLGVSLAGTQLRSDAGAHAATASVGALAMAEGSTVSFGKGQLAGSEAGRALVGHELTHVAQQRVHGVAARQGFFGLGDDEGEAGGGGIATGLGSGGSQQPTNRPDDWTLPDLADLPGGSLLVDLWDSLTDGARTLFGGDDERSSGDEPRDAEQIRNMLAQIHAAAAALVQSPRDLDDVAPDLQGAFDAARAAAGAAGYDLPGLKDVPQWASSLPEPTEASDSMALGLNPLTILILAFFAAILMLLMAISKSKPLKVSFPCDGSPYVPCGNLGMDYAFPTERLAALALVGGIGPIVIKPKRRDPATKGPCSEYSPYVAGTHGGVFKAGVHKGSVTCCECCHALTGARMTRCQAHP